MNSTPTFPTGYAASMRAEKARRAALTPAQREAEILARSGPKAPGIIVPRLPEGMGYGAFGKTYHGD